MLILVLTIATFGSYDSFLVRILLSEKQINRISEIIKGISVRISEIIKRVSENISRISENIKCIYLE